MLCRDIERSMICCTPYWACPPTCWVSQAPCNMKMLPTIYLKPTQFFRNLASTVRLCYLQTGQAVLPPIKSYDDMAKAQQDSLCAWQAKPCQLKDTAGVRHLTAFRTIKFSPDYLSLPQFSVQLPLLMSCFSRLYPLHCSIMLKKGQ